MPLASKNGKLLVKDGKLCSSCCSAEVIGCCYTYSYDNAGNPVFIVSKDTYSGCEEAQKNADPSFDVVWNKLDDPSAECPEDPFPPAITGACCYFYQASSDESSTKEWRCRDGITEQDCSMNGTNQTFYPGKTCEDLERDGLCPPPPPVGRCCLYKGEPLDMACGATFGECQTNRH